MVDFEKFFVVYFDGYYRVWNVNGGGCCGWFVCEGVDDIGFVCVVVVDIVNNVSIDFVWVYVMGMSNGVIMFYMLVCNISIFVVIGVVLGM